MLDAGMKYGFVCWLSSAALLLQSEQICFVKKSFFNFSSLCINSYK